MNSSSFDWDAMPETPTQVGTVRRFFEMPTTLLGELESHVTTLNPGASPHPPHQHIEEELIILRVGTLEAFMEGTTARIGPGSVLFFASNELHGLTNVGMEPAMYHVIRWRT